jgi:hypothetical protein
VVIGGGCIFQVFVPDRGIWIEAEGLMIPNCPTYLFRYIRFNELRTPPSVIDTYETYPDIVE